MHSPKKYQFRERLLRVCRSNRSIFTRIFQAKSSVKSAINEILQFVCRLFKMKKCLTILCKCENKNLQSHFQESNSHSVYIRLNTCEIRCSECEIEISDALMNSFSEKNDEIFNFRKLFFVNSEKTNGGKNIDLIKKKYVLTNLDFPIDYFFSSILFVFSDNLLQKIFKRMYIGGIAAYRLHSLSVFPVLGFLLGKIFYCVDLLQNDTLLVEEFFREMLKFSSFKTLYSTDGFVVI